METFEVRDIRNSDWYWIQRKIYEEYTSKIGVIGLALYNAYCSYANQKGKCYPSHKIISNKLKISRQTIIKYNKILEKNNLIKIENRQKENLPNIIYLVKLINKGVNDVDKACQTGLHKQEPYNNNKYNNDTKVSQKVEFGNKDINDLTHLLKAEYDIKLLDGSEKENRRFCWLALKKFKRSGVEAIIKIGAKDKFWRTKITSFKTLYYNGVKIASVLREKQQQVVKI